MPNVLLIISSSIISTFALNSPISHIFPYYATHHHYFDGQNSQPKKTNPQPLITRSLSLKNGQPSKKEQRQSTAKTAKVNNVLLENIEGPGFW